MEFDRLSKEIDEELIANQIWPKDVGMDQQHNDLVIISNNIERESHHGNLGEPIDTKP